MAKQLIIGVWRGVLATFSGRNLLWHLFAIIATALIVLSGFDWYFFVATRGEVANTLGMSAGILGFIVPVVLPACLYAIGYLRRDQNLKDIAVTAIKVVVVAIIIIAFYKALTGRIQPDFIASIASADNSRAFNFGFLRHGVFWGWPSSHSAVAVALSTYLILLYRHKMWVVTLSALFATLVAVGAGVSFHWLSDALAGAIIGTLIGYVIYKEKPQSLGSAE